MSKKLEDLYFIWLLKQLGNPQEKDYYNLLLKDLFNTDFTWDILYDENLEVWGLDLREDFYKSSNTIKKLVGTYGTINKPCSMLEMMVALSINCENNVMYDGINCRVFTWFWTMIESSGLVCYDDFNYNSEEIMCKIENILSHNYEADGKNGLFYVKNCKKDMRKMDIWMQLNTWLIANF